MLELFSRKTPHLLGIDISSSSVKLVELARDGERYRVEGYAVESLPAGTVTEKTITAEDVETVAAAIARVCKRAGTKTRSCALAVPSSTVITKVVTMPASLKEDELEAQVQMDAGQHIPFAIDDVNLDFDVLGATGGNPETIDVLLAASRRENVDLRVAAAEMAGMAVEIVDVEAYTIEHVWPLLAAQRPELSPDSIIAIIDAGATMSSIDIISGGSLIYTREQPFGGKNLTEEIMRRYGMSWEEACIARREGGLPDSYVPDVLEPFKGMVLQQVHRLLQLFYAAGQQNQIDHMFLGGNCATIDGIDATIAAELGTPTTIADPFAGMECAPHVNRTRLKDDAPCLLIACGLAMRRFDQRAMSA